MISTKSKKTKYKNGENMPDLEITKEVLVYCNIVIKHYLQDSRVLYKFVLNKSSGQLLGISAKKLF